VSGVSLERHDEFAGSFGDVHHRAFTITSESFFFTPSVVNPQGDRTDQHAWNSVSLHSFSMKGDRFHQFVERVCGGVWPAFGQHVEIKYSGCPYPSHFEFMGFKMVPDKGQCITLGVMSEELEEEYEIPLLAIMSLRIRSVFPLLRVTGMVDKPWKPVDVICNLKDSKWDRLWIKSYRLEGYAPQVRLGREINSLFEKVVDINALSEVYLVRVPPASLQVFQIPTGGLPRIFTAKVYIKWVAPAIYRHHDDKEYKVLGYTKCWEDQTDVEINLINPETGTRSLVPCKFIQSLNFRKRVE
jgi:hypothetical protein